jgi:large subunit ribosomal protein L18
MYKAPLRHLGRKQRKMRFWKNRRTRMENPRLCIFRSARHLQAQIIDDNAQKVLVCASTMEKDMRTLSLNGKDMAHKLGQIIAERAQSKDIQKVVFDRNGFTYHGRVLAFAESAREQGLIF